MEGKKSVAIGIDLGTTYSRVGVWKGDRVEIIPNDQRSRTTPCCVAFTKIESLVGEAALKQAEDNSTNTIYDAKRLIGRSFMDKQVKSDIKLWPFKIIESPGGYNRPLIEVNYHDQTKLLFAEEISSMIISKMTETAESYLGSDVQVKDAVITVPAYFNDFQRQATIDAAAIAGLNVLQIINEPTAAAIAYGIDKMSTGTKEVEKNVLVFDLGGGTCDVSIIGIRNHVFKVKAVCGDTHLGGEDFDNRMVHHFVAELKNKHDEDISKNHRSLWRLRVECEKAKRGLLLESEACIDVRSRIDNVNFNLKITREEFEDLNKDLFEKCLELVKNCLKEAKMTNKDVDDVVLVGGSSQITKIQSLLLEKNLFNKKKLYKSINPDEDVARGAAVQAAILSGACNNNDIVIEDIIPMSLGIDSYGKDMRVVIPKNVAIPSKKVDKLVTPKDNQEVVTLDVYEGEKRIAKNNNFLGTFEIHGITPTSDHKFDVCFEIDKNGILTVSPDHQGTNNKNQICIIDQRISLSKAEIDRMIKTAKKCKAEDKRFKNLIKSRLALRDYAKKMQELFKDKKKFRGKDTQKVEDAKTFIQDTIKWHDSKINLKRAIEFEDKLKELKKIVDPLVAD